MWTGKRPNLSAGDDGPPRKFGPEILHAASELLFSNGMSGFTIDESAASSGASKPSTSGGRPRALSHSVATSKKVEPDLTFPDTGDASSGPAHSSAFILGVLHEGRGGAVIGELIGQAQADPELQAAFLQRYSDRAVLAPSKHCARLGARGQVRAPSTRSRRRPALGRLLPAAHTGPAAHERVRRRTARQFVQRNRA